tara:strand:- start:130 stop:612 length:483 start_codon:yes stop_codon:yes gene_type:complete
MEKKYIVIDTWNGEGYSSDNGREIKYFSSKDEAINHAKQRRKENLQINQTPIETCKDIFGWGNEEIGEYGSYQVYELKEDDYAVEIIVNVNEVVILTEKRYEERIKELNEEVFESMYKAMTSDDFHAPTDIEEYIYLDDNKREPFYHGVNDYDYQFRILK